VNAAYVHAATERRIIWVMYACLALPVDHHLRVRRIPELATKLAVHAGQRRKRWVN